MKKVFTKVIESLVILCAAGGVALGVSYAVDRYPLSFAFVVFFVLWASLYNAVSKEG